MVWTWTTFTVRPNSSTQPYKLCQKCSPNGNRSKIWTSHSPLATLTLSIVLGLHVDGRSTTIRGRVGHLDPKNLASCFWLIETVCKSGEEVQGQAKLDLSLDAPNPAEPNRRNPTEPNPTFNLVVRLAQCKLQYIQPTAAQKCQTYNVLPK